MSTEPEMTASEASPPGLRVEATGISGLDAILGGGLPRGSLVLLVGPPGTGKTTVAAHMAFAAARRGRRVVFVTAFSEPTDKLIAHLRTYAFFDETLVGDHLEIVTLASMLPEGVTVAAEQIMAEVRRRRADLLILDGFHGIRLAATSPLESRAFLYELGGALGVVGITTVVTADSDHRGGIAYGEATGADVLLSLSLAVQGVRPRRAIEPVKMRGAAPMLGLHGLTIDQQGAEVFPRLEARVIAETYSGAPAPLDGSRASFSLPELDGLLGGGLTRGTSTVVLGSLGTGKTLLGLHFALAGIAAGEPAVFLSFHEDEAELRLKANAFTFGGTFQRALAPGGGLVLLRQPAIERDADLIAHELLAAVDRTGARRVVIDSIVEVERAVTETSDAARVPNYLAALTEALRLRRATALMIKEHGEVSAMAMGLAADPISVVASSVLWLQQFSYRDRLCRVLSIPKMRFSSHDVRMREFAIEAPAGLVVRGPFESEHGFAAGLRTYPPGASAPAP